MVGGSDFLQIHAPPDSAGESVAHTELRGWLMARLDDLVKLREDLLAWLEEAPADRKAALVAQYRATLAEIDELEPKEAAGDGIDEIAKRRAARRSSPAKTSGRTQRTS